MTIGLAVLSIPSQATELEKLLMPGQLARAHSDIEAECTKCHDGANRPRQRQLCLDCHKEVAGDVARKTGFHWRAAATAQCNACHTEHKGRGADTVGFSPEAFDHARTDFSLAGAHASVPCATCHKAGKKYREAPRACLDCHREDDVHDGKLGTDCADCHETVRFKTTSFDHAKTKFPLHNAHAKVACFACHRDATFKGAPGRCVDCHASDDVHRGSRGPDCASCHGTADWKQNRFNHLKASDYALVGKHAKLACDSCHRGGDLKAELPRECNGCHQAVDPHSGRFGTACADCHEQDKWAVAAFDHEKRAKFALRGAHAKLECHACHTGVLKKQQMQKECVGCHGVDDVHKGSMGRDCQSCHNPNGWDFWQFDHGTTRFMLTGAHGRLGCRDCHRKPDHDLTLSRECATCHRADDVHDGQFGPDCGRCHGTESFDRVLVH